MEQGMDRGEDLDVYCRGGESRSERGEERRRVAVSGSAAGSHQDPGGDASPTHDGDGDVGPVGPLTQRHHAGPLAAVSAADLHLSVPSLHFLPLRIQPVNLRRLAAAWMWSFADQSHGLSRKHQRRLRRH